jgi:hypothetical protein
MGAIGGTIWHGIKGARNAPRVCHFIQSLSGTYCFNLYYSSREIGSYLHWLPSNRERLSLEEISGHGEGCFQHSIVV